MINLAFSNPEYMTLNEINESLTKFKRENLVDLTSTVMSTPRSTNSMKRRLVPLPPPPSHAPVPPCLPPPIINRVKLYQNVDHFNQPIMHQEPIHVDCNFFRTPTTNKKRNTLSNDNNFLLTTANQNNSLMYLTSNNNNNSATSDSSSATMIVKKSPNSISSSSFHYEEDEDDALCSRGGSKVTEQNPKSIGSLSPIMTSSRADLNSFSTALRIVSLINNNNELICEEPIDEEQDEDEKFTTLINNQTLLVTNSLPLQRVKHYDFKRSSLSKEADFIENVTLQENVSRKSFNNYNYELVQVEEDSNESSSDSLILLPPSPFKTLTPVQNSINNNNKSNIKTAKGSAKKVSFMIRETHHSRNIDQYYYDEVFEEEDDEFLISTEEDQHIGRQRRNSLSSGSSSSCSTNSSIDTASNNTISKIVFTNNHYFVSAADKRSQQSSTALSSSSPFMPTVSCSSSSSCSSTSSSSSGYKSNQSSSLSQPVKYVISPSELDHFIKISKDRLDRLKMKRFQLITDSNCVKMVQPSDNDEVNFERFNSNTLKRSKPAESVNSTVTTTTSNYADSSLFKNVSAKLFQKLLHNKQLSNSSSSNSSPCNTLPRRSK
jgi:hypothetical protein